MAADDTASSAARAGSSLESGRWRWLFGPAGWALLLVLALAVRLPYMFGPYSGLEHDFLSHFGAYTTGVHARNLAQHGLGDSLGMPYFWRVQLADGTWAHQHYLHHPAGIVWVHVLGLKLFGVTAFGMRMPSLLFSMFSCVSVGLFARRLFGARVAAGALLAMALLPYSVHYATQAWTDAAHVGTGTAMLLFVDRWIAERRGRDLALACCFTAAGGLLDWPAHFWLPPLAVLLLVRARAEGGLVRLLPLFALPAVAVATIGLHWLHMNAVAGAEVASGDTAHTLSKNVGINQPLLRFAGNQLRYWIQHVTWPGALLIALGALLSLAPRRTGIAALARSPRAIGLLWVAAFPGLEYVLAFPGRSTNHVFFPMLSLPFYSISAALTLVWVWDRKSRLARPLGLTLAAGFCAACLQRDHQLWSAIRSPQMDVVRTTPEIAAWIDDPDALVLTHIGRGMALCFYSAAQVIPSVDTQDLLAERLLLLRQLQPGRRAVYLADLKYLAAIDPDGTLRQSLRALGEIQLLDTPAGRFGLLPLTTGDPAR